MFEGVPSYPNSARFWQICEKFKVNIFYTAPTVIRSLMRDGVEPTQRYDLSSLRILGSVGEPINPEAWIWYHDNIGKGKLPIVDTWWQTETGGIMISALPYATPLKPGSATRPLPGIDAAIYNEEGQEAAPNEGGHLVIKQPWPGMLRGIYGDPARFKKTYFTRYAGIYDPEDGARRDQDGYFWIMGRLDDVINVSGHRLGTAEIESALVAHPDVAEAAVVGAPHEIKGQTIYSYVTLKAGIQPTDELRAALKKHVRQEIGPIAMPEIIQFSDGSAQDPQRQDHAADPAQDRGRPDRGPRFRRYLDPGRPFGSRHPGGRFQTVCEVIRPPSQLKFQGNRFAGSPFLLPGATDTVT